MISVHKFKEEKEIWQAASECFIDCLTLFGKSGKKTLILLSGGSVVGMYKNLELGIDNLLAFGQVDERFLPEAKTNNKNMENLNSHLIEKMGLWERCKKFKIPYYLISQEGTLEQAADEYDQTISKLFKEYTYKIAVLGIGEDGHTAGMLPGYRKKWDVERWVVGYRNEGKYKERITLTPKALKELDLAIVVSSGVKKRKIVKAVLDPTNEGHLNDSPGVILQEMKQVKVYQNF